MSAPKTFEAGDKVIFISRERLLESGEFIDDGYEDDNDMVTTSRLGYSSKRGVTDEIWEVDNTPRRIIERIRLATERDYPRYYYEIEGFRGYGIIAEVLEFPPLNVASIYKEF